MGLSFFYLFRKCLERKTIMKQEELNEILEEHKKWLADHRTGKRANLKEADLIEANLKEADLRGADLIEADLRGANLRGADLDYSCLPLWCGSLDANFDDRQLKQIAYHLVRSGLNSGNASDETKAELEKLIDFANGFHRVDECGKIEKSRNEQSF